MAIAKIVLNSDTQIDLTQDTVASADHIRSGYVGHLNDGTQVTGSYTGGSATLTTKSITENGTYSAEDDDADGYSEVTVNVPAYTGKKVKTGTVTFSSDYTTTGNRQITTVATIGFTPTRFYLHPASKSSVTSSSNSIVSATYELNGTSDYLRTYVRTTNTSGSLGIAQNTSSWTTQTNGYLYLSDGTIYYRTASSSCLRATTYNWIAVE